MNQSQKLRHSILCADLLWIAVAFTAAHLLQNDLIANRAGLSRVVYVPEILVALAIWIVLFVTKKVEDFLGWSYLPTISAQVVVGVLYLMGSALTLAFFAKYDFSRLMLLYLGVFLIIGLVTIRCATWWLVTSRSRAGMKRRVVILGSGHIVRELALKISHHPETSMEVAGVLFPSDIEPYGQVSNLPANPVPIRTLNVLGLLREKHVQELIVVEPLRPGPEAAKLIASCREAGMRVHLVPQHYELYLSKAKLTEIDDVPLVTLEGQSPSRAGLMVKRAMDLPIASFLLVLCAPLLLLSALALRWRNRTAFRKELRCGKNGMSFWMYRLNIDRDAPQLDDYERVLVKFSLTELPQLWNVLKGDMALVGPRPEPFERVKRYSLWQRQRLTITPGLTGLAQVNGLRERHSSEEKAHFDLQYIFHWSLFLDLSLVLQTGWVLFVRVMEGERFAVPSILSVPSRRS